MNKRMLGLLLALIMLSGLLAVMAEPTEEPDMLDPLSGYTYALVGTPGGPLNMRRSGRLTSPIIGEIPNGTTIAILTQEESWCEAVYDGTKGYVTDKYLTFLYELPFEQMERGSFGPGVVKLKERLQELDYFRPGASEMTVDYSMTTEDRVKLFEKANGMEPTGIATPALQAFLFWGPAVRYTEPLPTAFYATAPGATPTPVPTPTPASGFPPTKHP